MSNNELRAVPGFQTIKDATNYGSLEDIHNAVHNLVGGAGGHMSGIDVSAFDPIFWLRKYNRILTLSLTSADREQTMRAFLLPP